MSGGGGGSTQTTNTIAQLPAYAIPASVDLLHRGQNLSQQPYPFPEQQVSPLNPTQLQGLQAASDRATQGSSALNASGQNLTDTLSGKYLDINTNPAWAPTAQRITDAYSTGTAAQTDAAAARANAFGSSGYNQLAGLNARSLGDSLAGAAGDLYNTERQRQMQASLLAPANAQAGYQDAQALLGVGDTQRQYAQDVLNNNYMNQYNRAQYPYSQLDVLGNSIRAATGTSGQTTTTGPNPYQPNKTANAFGGALAGAATGAYIGSVYPGIGTAVGGVAGGAIGLLGGLL